MNVYKNKINKNLNNSQMVYSTMNNDINNNVVDISIDRNIKYSNISIDRKIDDIFNSNDYVYKADVKIALDDKVIEKRIVARNKNNLITMDNEYIPINVIRDIYK